MDIKNMLLPEKVVTFDYPGAEGLTFDLAFLSKEELLKLQRLCTTKKMDSRTRQPYDYFDDDKFLSVYVKKIIRGWKGFKIKHLREMVLIDADDDQDDEEINFSDEQALVLMQSSSTLDSWVSEQIGDLGKFSKSSSKKNSLTSVNTSKVVVQA